MSFKQFIYYCAICGGWAALLCWGLIMLFNLQDTTAISVYLKTALSAGLLGLTVGLAVSALDALLNSAGFARLVRIIVCGIVAVFGGMLAGFVGEGLNIAMHTRVIGWTLVGLTIGASIGVFDLLRNITAGQGIGMAIRKIINGIIGGSFGGLVGGILYEVVFRGLLEVMGLELKRSGLAIGLVILGMCIGLLVSVAQVVLKQAAIKVEAGFRAGRQMILSKAETTMGRAESCDIGLFGDPGIEKLHAKIVKKGNRFVLMDTGTPGGTYLNGEMIDGPTPLRSGDRIGMGRAQLLFTESKI
jgi:hypothetical protein